MTRLAADVMGAETVSRAIVEAIADAKGVSPVDLQPPLYEAVDPDALEQFVASVHDRPNTTDLRVTFTYAGHEVTVSGDGDVSIEAE